MKAREDAATMATMLISASGGDLVQFNAWLVHKIAWTGDNLPDVPKVRALQLANPWSPATIEWGWQFVEYRSLTCIYEL